MSAPPVPIEGPANAGARSLPIERYAQVRAEMEAGALRDEVLARAGVTADAWAVVQRGWLERMGAELERGRFELSNRYTQAFLARQRELAAPPAAPALIPAAPAEGPPAPPPPALARPSPETPSPPLPPATVRTGLPATPSPAAPAPAAVWTPAPRPRAAPSTGTTGPINLSAVLGSALPFVPSPATPPIAPSAEPAPDSADPETVPTAARTPPLQRPDPAASDPCEAGARAGLPVRRTLPPASSNPAPSLPFRPVGPGAAPAPPSSPDLISALAGASLESVLPLSRYASLCAELSLFPRAAEEIFPRYGLEDPKKRSAVDAAWQERLRLDPDEYKSWQDTYWRHYTHGVKGGAPR